MKTLSNKFSCEFVLIPHIISEEKPGWEQHFISLIISHKPRDIPVTHFKTSELLAKGNNLASYIKSVTGSMDFLITTRYHGIIFALSKNVPCLALTYDDYYLQKNTGALKLIYGENVNKYLVDLSQKNHEEEIRKKAYKILLDLHTEKEILRSRNASLSTRKSLLTLEDVLCMVL